MIISDKYEFIYIRTPKTASTSIESFLRKCDPSCSFEKSNTLVSGHYIASQIKHMVGKKKWDKYFKFTFIREPFSWIKSNYSYNTQFFMVKPNMKELGVLLDEDMRLEIPPLQANDKRILTKLNILKFYMFQACWFSLASKGIIQSDWVDEKIDYIGVTDNINQFFKKFKHKYNFNDNLELPLLNQSESLKYTFDTEAIELINILYKKDIELYDFVIKNNYVLNDQEDRKTSEIID